jgi:S1-C subfamily serine protease
VASGRPKASRPWLGLNSDEIQKDGVLVVGNVSRDGPAAKAGLKRGDVVFGLDGKPIKGLADFYKRLWSMGEPGVEVPLKVMQADGVRELKLISGDRYKNMRAQPTY